MGFWCAIAAAPGSDNPGNVEMGFGYAITCLCEKNSRFYNALNTWLGQGRV
ncbi:hypothetical protein [Moorena sp. SIO4G3]|uniref:hypothetical protein n=1 Tax=Moorena sp. SIO4G3 TaxID=2607821 RepID=UPI00142A533B|nr:hypothetical protein [Moorena sp. SIO4G3]NEO82448.1 hypothetical protein [Moorena sp. SIO4G3]